MNEYPLAPLDRLNHGTTAFLVVFMVVVLNGGLLAPCPVCWNACAGDISQYIRATG